MVDTATSRYGARKQSLGSNVNTWGDTKLNDVFDLLDRGSKGYQSIATTGDTTLSWTSYATANDGQVQTLKLTGSLSSAAALIVPSREWAFTVINSSGATVTVRTSAGTGVAIPTGSTADLYCDGTDVGNAAATYVGARISGVTDAANSDQAVNKGQMETAIAVLLGTTTAGLVLNSVGDLAAGYLTSKLTVASPLTKTTTNAGTVNEATEIGIVVDEGNQIFLSQVFS